MKKTLLRMVCCAATLCVCGHASAQEEVSAITPLKITSGLNADVIAEKKVLSSSDYTRSNGYYRSKYATNIDGDEKGGRFAYFTTAVQEKGAIKYKTEDGNTYLDGNSDGIPYHIENADVNNACLIKAYDTNTYTLTLSQLNDKPLLTASTIYLLATSAEGNSKVTIDIIGNDNNKVGTTTVTVGDWYSGRTTERLTQVYEAYRMTVLTENIGMYNNPNDDAYINYINGSGCFYLQRIAISTLSTEPIKEIRIKKEYFESDLVILAATAVTEEVTEKDNQSTLEYLKNTTTKQRIAETVKYRVNLHRNFKADMWQPFVFNCELTAAQAKTMFGQDVKLSKITDLSYQGKRIIFYPIDLSSEDEVVIKKGEYYLIKIPSASIASIDETTNLQKYTCDYVQFRACEDYDTGLTTTKTISNGEGSTATFHGVYVSGQSIGVGSYAVSGGKFYKYTDNPTIGAFRFWMTISGAQSEAKEMNFDICDETTGISMINVDNEGSSANGAVYTLDGRLIRQGTTSLDGLAKGLYIVNKKKIMVK